MKKMQGKYLGFTLISSLFWLTPVMADLKDNVVVALDPSASRVVVKTLDNKMVVLRPGDSVPDSQAVVSQVLIDRMVVIDTLGGKEEKKQTVWIFKSTKANAKSRIQRLDREGPKSSRLKPVIQQETRR